MKRALLALLIVAACSPAYDNRSAPRVRAGAAIDDTDEASMLDQRSTKAIMLWRSTPAGVANLPKTITLVDFSAGAPNVTVTRAGATIYAQNGSAGAFTAIGSNTAVNEDPGDGLGNRTWFFPSYTNDVTAPFDLTNAFWSKLNASAPTSVAGPLAGGPNASRIEDTSGTSAAILYNAGFASSPNRFASLFVRNDTPAPTSPPFGFTHYYPVNNGALNTIDAREIVRTPATNSAWSRVRVRTHGVGAVGNLCIAPSAWTGTPQAGYNESGTGTGAVVVWGVQSTTAAGDVPLAAAGSATGDNTGQLPASIAANMVQGGDLDLEIDWSAVMDRWSAVSGTQLNTPSGYVWLASTPDGELSLRYDQGTVGNNYVDDAFILRVRGVDVLTMAGNGSNTQTLHGHRYQDRVRVRAWYRVSTGTCGIRYSVNGVASVNTGAAGSGSWGVTGTASGAPLATPTAAWLASNAGAAPIWTVAFVGQLNTHVKTDVPAAMQPEFVWIGDSTSAPYGRCIATLSAILRPTEATSRQGSLSLATAGETIQQQQARWIAIPDKSKIAAVAIYCGFNNLNGSAESASTVLGRIQTLINQIKSDRPKAKVILFQLHGANTWLGTVAKQQAWQDVNSGIAGGTGVNSVVTPITGADAVVTSHVATLNGGVVTSASYDMGNNYALSTGDVHPNDPGRLVIAAAGRTAFQGLSLLP